jgi:hypothetical protein
VFRGGWRGTAGARTRDSCAREDDLAVDEGEGQSRDGAGQRSLQPGADGVGEDLLAPVLELSQDGKITKFTVVWDGSLLDDPAITALAAHAVER